MAGYDVDAKSYKVPSLALKLGHSLNTCAKIMRSEATVSGDDANKKTASDFMNLYRDDRNDRISAHAISTLHTHNYNKPKLLPLTSDIIKLQQYLCRQAELLRSQLQHDVTCYSKLAQVCLTQLILFNRKRCGEAERLKLDEFEKGMNAQYEFDEADLSKVLSKFEMHLVQSHKRIETRGKKARKEQLADNNKVCMCDIFRVYHITCK